MKKNLLSLFVLWICLGHAASLQAQVSGPKLIGVFNRYWNQTYWSMLDSLAIGYNSAGQDSVEVHYYGDEPFTGIWTASTKCLTSYNGNGSVKQRLYFSLDSLAAWDTTSRSTYTYNGNNQVTLAFSENYTPGSGWSSYYQTITGYDANGNKTSETNQSMNATTHTWNNDSDQKHTYVYDSSNFLISHTLQLWNTASSGYVNLDNNIYTNDGMGHPLVTLNQFWDGVSHWYDMDRDSSIYDSQGNVVLHYHRYRHQGGMDQWGMQYRETYTYTAAGKISTLFSESWDLASQAFVIKGSSISNSYYNANNDITKASSANWDSTLNGYQVMMESYFHYSSLSVTSIGIAADRGNPMNVYPNPFSNRLTLETPAEAGSNTKVYLFDMAGHEMTSDISVEKGRNNISIDTGNLPAGIYVLKVASGNSQYLKKIMKVN